MHLDRRLFLLGAAATGACASIPPTPAEPAALWSGLLPGRHGAGFRMEWLRDPSRRAWGEAGNGRPIQLWHWFPAQPGSGQRMRIADYAALFAAPSLAGVAAPAGWPREPEQALHTGYTPPLPENGYGRLTPLLTMARQQARQARGRFPVVLIGQGYWFESPFHQHVVAEYLATHGYRVMSAPLTGASGRAAAVDRPTIEAQIGDLLFLMNRVERGTPIGLLGFDLGGMATYAIAESRQVQALIGLDTGIIAPRLVEDLLVPRAGFRFEDQRAPYLHFTRPSAENQARNLPEDLALFERDGGPVRHLVRVPGMRHADFTVTGAIEGVFPAFWGPAPGNPANHYPVMLSLIRDALDHWLKGRGSGRWTPRVPAPLTIRTWS